MVFYLLFQLKGIGREEMYFKGALFNIFMMVFGEILETTFLLTMILWKQRYRKERKPEYFILMEICYLLEINLMEKH